MTNQPKLHQSDQKSVSLKSLVHELNQLVGDLADHSYLSLPDVTMAEIQKNHRRFAPFARPETLPETLIKDPDSATDPDTTSDANLNIKE